MFSLLSLAASVVLPLALASPTARMTRGTLLSPTDGSTYNMARGEYHLLFKRVPETVDVSVFINELNDTYPGVPYPVVLGLQSCNSGQDEYIDAHILLPPGFCGDYEFSVTEHQTTPPDFVTASPTVHVICPSEGSSPHKREMEERSVLPSLVLPYNNQQFTDDLGQGSSIELLLIGDGQGDKGINVTIAANQLTFQLAVGLASTACSVPGLPTYQAFFSPPSAACGPGTFSVSVDEAGHYPSVSTNIQMNCPPDE